MAFLSSRRLLALVHCQARTRPLFGRFVIAVANRAVAGHMQHRLHKERRNLAPPVSGVAIQFGTSFTIRLGQEICIG